MFSKLKANKDKALALFVASPVVLGTMGITASGGVVQFDATDKSAIEEGFINSLSNLWSGFTAVLPYLGMAVGVTLVFGLVFKLIFKGR